MKILFVSYFFPPTGAVQRPLKFAERLAARGFKTHVLAPDDPKWIYADHQIHVPDSVAVHRSRFLGPRAHRLGDELYGKHGAAKALTHLRRLFPRLLVPDEFVAWSLTAGPAAIRLVRRHRIDLVMTSSSPGSVHLIGALVKRATGAIWVADVRDSLSANPHRQTERALVRVKQIGERNVAGLVARYADAVVTATEAIAAEIESLGCSVELAVIRNGCDFADFAGLDYSPGERFRLTHTGSFYGGRDPRPVLTAVAQSGLDVTTRFVGDFRPRDRAYAAELRIDGRLELHGYVDHRRSCELQRDSEALLLLIPNARGRGRGVVPAKLFEYIAAARPILAAVPLDGEAATIVRDLDAGPVVDPDDVAAIGSALGEMVERFEKGSLAGPRIPQAAKHRLSRESRVGELAALFTELMSLRAERTRRPCARRASS
jgi:glycosyltransferase involved in cell wall biosynthesis